MKYKHYDVEYVDPSTLTVPPTHANTHSHRQIAKLKKSIETNGCLSVLVADKHNVVYAGAARLEALKQLGCQKVPVIRPEGLSEAQLRAFALADNRIAQDSQWDDGLLKIELSYLVDCDTEIDLDTTGFETAEIDNLLIVESMESSAGEPPIPDNVPFVTQPGDVWLLVPHRIACGDSTSPAQMAALTLSTEAVLHISDPPYNVPTRGHISTTDDADHGDFVMAAGEMSAEEFTDFLVKALIVLANVCGQGSLHYLFMDWRHLRELLAAVDAVFSEQLNLCVWAKTNGGMGSFYRSQHELVVVAKKGTAPHINNIQLGAHGRYRTNLWRYAGMNTFGSDREECLAAHPTVKPLKMIADIILDASKLGDVVLDGFLGSGTTLLACEQTKRICRGMELDPRYVDVAIRRWETLTGGHAVHEDSGKTFSELAAASGCEPEEVLS